MYRKEWQLVYYGVVRHAHTGKLNVEKIKDSSYICVRKSWCHNAAWLRRKIDGKLISSSVARRKKKRLNRMKRKHGNSDVVAPLDSHVSRQDRRETEDDDDDDEVNLGSSTVRSLVAIVMHIQ